MIYCAKVVMIEVRFRRVVSSTQEPAAGERVNCRGVEGLPEAIHIRAVGEYPPDCRLRAESCQNKSEGFSVELWRVITPLLLFSEPCSVGVAHRKKNHDIKERRIS